MWPLIGTRWDPRPQGENSYPLDLNVDVPSSILLTNVKSRYSDGALTKRGGLKPSKISVTFKSLLVREFSYDQSKKYCFYI